jgi:penicillin-binding protein 1C
MAAAQGTSFRLSARFLIPLGAAVVAAGLALLAAVYLVDYPVGKLAPEAAASLELVDRSGNLLRALPIRGGGRATWVGLDQVAPSVILATLASEDHRFFEHHGVDGRAVVRALWLDLRARRARSGASTLTMQLVRMIEPRPRGLANKLREAVLALRLERALNKQQILEQYLNRAYYGNGAFGIEQASRYYFGKPASALGLAEGALLAILPRAPRTYDPQRHLPAALARRAHVLDLLEERGLVTREERQRAETTALAFTFSAPEPGLAPHFCDWVLAGLSASQRAQGGRLRTTLDLDLQRALERAVQAHVDERRELGLREAGAVMLEPSTGAVLAMVGSPDYAAPAGQLNITTTPRHPGSALKPLLYALAIERGDTPATVAFDVADAESEWHPRPEVRQHGPARYREALAGSYNLAAVHVLEQVGVENLLRRLRVAGLGPLTGTAADYRLGLALGSAKVRLVDLAAAYGFLVNHGTVARAHGVGSPAEPVQLFDERVSWLVMDMLADADARRQVFGAELPVDLPFPVAIKTGTSGGFADTVAVGATREVIVAAWAGNFDGSGTRGSLAMWSAAPLVRAGLLAMAARRSLTLPPRPDGIVERAVCRLSGLRPGPYCATKSEFFVAGSEPVDTCTWHRLRHGRVTVEFPAALAAWATRRGQDLAK